MLKKMTEGLNFGIRVEEKASELFISALILSC